MWQTRENGGTEVATTLREKDRGRCSNESIEDENEWTLKDRKTKTEVERCTTKGYERDTSIETREDNFRMKT